MILDAMFAELATVAETWQVEAANRRRFTKTDPVADTLEHCAGELASQVEALKTGVYYLTVEDYAALNDVSPPTVRAWIKTGQLRAISTESGWKIRKDEKRRKRA